MRPCCVKAGDWSNGQARSDDITAHARYATSQTEGAWGHGWAHRIPDRTPDRTQAGQLPFLITEVVAVPDEGKNALGVAKRKDDTKLVQLLSAKQRWGNLLRQI